MSIDYKYIENIKYSEEVLKNKTIVIEGVVGVGKTTLMEVLSSKLDYIKYEEPVVNNPFLSAFYNDRIRYSFPLQMFFLKERFKLIKDANKKNQKSIMDRSIYADTIFANILYKNGELSKEEYDLYEDFKNTMLEHVEVPKLMIYLRCSVDTAINRIKKRNRDYEQSTEREYWENLNCEYEEYFNSYKKSNILIIDVDDVNIFDKNHMNQLIDIIEQYI